MAVRFDDTEASPIVDTLFANKELASTNKSTLLVYFKFK